MCRFGCKQRNKQMKTAMQQLKEMIQGKISECSTESRRYTFIQVLELIDVAEIIEQEQLDNAYDKGKEDGMFAERQIHVN